jgi:hypothetical protein
VLNYSFYNKITNKLKIYIGFYSFFNSCTVQALIFRNYNYLSVDIGFKYTINIFNYVEPYNKLVFNILNFQTKNNQLFIRWTNINKNLHLKFCRFILIKALKSKYILSGKILNSTQKIFSVGILGFVCLLPKKKAVTNHIGNNSLFIINKFDKIFIVSQKQIIRLISRTLIKLFSAISYILRN